MRSALVVAVSQMVGGNLARTVRLKPYRLAALKRHGMPIAEALHALKRPEIMIERPVLHHHDDDMLDILHRAGASIGRYGKRLLDADRQQTWKEPPRLP